MKSTATEAVAKPLALNMRVDPKKRALIDRAVAELGGDRTSFIVEAACKRAEEVLMDRRYYMLDEDDYAFFEKAINKPMSERPCLQKLLNKRPSWESLPQNG
ncbi:type II toxin-antitoxin system TacA family antitoxin [Halomonas sp. AOP43-D1-12]|uniref:type II toxin-antitoxin system TacA family antitoxin n=1 Tax=Halomonas sp. AOP43-D1-12 TaxID=3457660 RepID=UPI0040334BD9